MIYGGFALTALLLLLDFWPQWVHIPWWQTLLLLSFSGGLTANSKDLTRALLGKPE